MGVIVIFASFCRLAKGTLRTIKSKFESERRSGPLLFGSGHVMDPIRISTLITLFLLPLTLTALTLCATLVPFCLDFSTGKRDLAVRIDSDDDGDGD